MPQQPARQIDTVITSVRTTLRAFVNGYLRSCGQVFRTSKALSRFADIFHGSKVPQRYLHVLANLYSVSLLQRGPGKRRYAAPRALRAAVASLDSNRHRNLVRDVLKRFDNYQVTRTTDQHLRLLTPLGVILAKEVVLPWFGFLEHLRDASVSGIDDWQDTGRLLWKLRGSRSAHPVDRPRINSLDSRTPTIPAEHTADLEETLSLIRRPSSDAEILILTLLLPVLHPTQLEPDEQKRLANALERFRVGLNSASARDVLNGSVEKRGAALRQQFATARRILADLRQDLAGRLPDEPATSLALGALDAAIEGMGT